jgi:hypothetical protein
VVGLVVNRFENSQLHTNPTRLQPFSDSPSKIMTKIVIFLLALITTVLSQDSDCSPCTKQFTECKSDSCPLGTTCRVEPQTCLTCAVIVCDTPVICPAIDPCSAIDCPSHLKCMTIPRTDFECPKAVCEPASPIICLQVMPCSEVDCPGTCTTIPRTPDQCARAVCDPVVVPHNPSYGPQKPNAGDCVTPATSVETSDVSTTGHYVPHDDASTAPNYSTSQKFTSSAGYGGKMGWKSTSLVLVVVLVAFASFV